MGGGKVVILGANVQSKGRKGACIFTFHKLLAKIVDRIDVFTFLMVFLLRIPFVAENKLFFSFGLLDVCFTLTFKKGGGGGGCLIYMHPYNIEPP